jgi:hypothetical protein
MDAVSRLHYIPLSTSYAEIYNIHAFFSGGTSDALAVVNSTVQHLPRDQRIPFEGDNRLRRIARAGKNWKNTIGRRADMEGEHNPTSSSPCTEPISSPSSYSVCLPVVLRVCSARSGQS